MADKPLLPAPLPRGDGEGKAARDIPDEQPLQGLRIAVTRPREQAADLARRIAQLGASALSFPLLEISAAPNQAALREQRASLSSFNLLIFISPNAVKYGMAAFAPLPANVRVAAVGQGSARELRASGITDVIAPTGRFDSEALLDMPELQQVSGWRVAILRGDGGRELLGDTLKERGAVVEYITCYRRGKAALDVTALLQAAPDAITVTSSEALDYLWAQLDGEARLGLAAVPLFVPHARIAELARRQAWQRVVVTASGDDGMIAGLVAWANGRRN